MREIGIDLKGESICYHCHRKAERVIIKVGLFHFSIRNLCDKHWQEEKELLEYRK